MNALLNAVTIRLKYTSFREEREFLTSLKRLIENGCSKGMIQNWLEEAQARTCGSSFSSVYRSSTTLLDEFFPVDYEHPWLVIPPYETDMREFE